MEQRKYRGRLDLRRIPRDLLARSCLSSVLYNEGQSKVRTRSRASGAHGVRRGYRACMVVVAFQCDRLFPRRLQSLRPSANGAAQAKLQAYTAELPTPALASWKAATSCRTIQGAGPSIFDNLTQPPAWRAGGDGPCRRPP